MVPYVVIIIFFMFYLLIPAYAHKVSRGEDLKEYADKIIQLSAIMQFIFTMILIWKCAGYAILKDIELQGFVSAVISLIISALINLIMVAYLTERYIPKISLSMDMYDRILKDEVISIAIVLIIGYFITLYVFYNQFTPYNM